MTSSTVNLGLPKSSLLAVGSPQARSTSETLASKAV